MSKYSYIVASDQRKGFFEESGGGEGQKGPLGLGIWRKFSGECGF